MSEQENFNIKPMESDPDYASQPFELVSEFEPAGDQPAAIEELVEGLGDDEKHQVLLGATGTGKSLGYHDHVFIVEDVNGSRRARVVEIGPLIDDLLEANADRIARRADTELIDTTHFDELSRFYTQSIDPETGQVGLYPIRSFIRHDAPAQMFALRLSCGREATLTPDHNLWVARDGQLELIETADARPTDFIPLPRKLAAGSNQAELVNANALVSANAAAIDEPTSAPLDQGWSNASDASLIEALRARFVRTALGVTSAPLSRQDASHLCYALARFGAPSALARVDDGTYTVSVPGARAPRDIGARGFEDIDDLVPIARARLIALRDELGMSEGDLVRLSGVLLDDDADALPRRDLEAVLATLRRVANHSDMTDDWWEAWDNASAMCSARWSRVSSVAPTSYTHPHVYDLCVPGPETFLGGAGGMFVHNTFTISNVIERVQKPTLVMAPNKTLAAQLYNELKELFPNNAVEYFVSYYDYYQPEAYIPSSDTFIEKDSAINDAIDRMRHAATRSLFERRDVIIVASVSCIYGLGSSEAYLNMMVWLEAGTSTPRNDILQKLIEIQYERNDYDFHRGTFRVRGDIVEIFPAHEEERALRVEMFGDDIEAIYEIDPLRGKRLRKLDRCAIYPNSHHVILPDKKKAAIESIQEELRECEEELVMLGKLIEAQRLSQRTQFDLEMMVTTGYCKGVENYSRHLSGRAPGEAPPCLLDYFPEDWLLVVDESHVTIPQIGGMFRGDRARKDTLIGYGFRLPSARDNRPLKFDEFMERVNQAIYISATPGNWELEQTAGVVTEQIIRPTGLIDPEIEIRPATDQVDDVYGEVVQRIEWGHRVLITTLTKRMSEDLTEYLNELGIKVRYLHSDIDTIERMNLIRDLRKGVFDVLIGINLLREGLDIPEVSLVAILDADKEGFLRSERSLVQTIGRAARNAQGKVILYADKLTDSMKGAISETNRRRKIQRDYNEEHGITPRTITKKIHDLEQHIPEGEDDAATETEAKIDPTTLSAEELDKMISDLRKQMREVASELKFEEAAALRDKIRALEAARLQG